MNSNTVWLILIIVGTLLLVVSAICTILLRKKVAALTGELSRSKRVPESVIERASEWLRYEETLRKSEQRTRLALDAADAGIWEWDLKTGKNVWTDELWNLYHLESEKHLASYDSWFQSVHSDDREKTAAAVQDALVSGSMIHLEWRVNTGDASEIWLMSRGMPQKNENGDIISYHGVVINITERKNHEASARRWQAIFEKALFGLVLTDATNESIIQANLSYSRQRGYEPEELEGKSIWIVYPAHEVARVKEIIREIDRDGHGVFEAWQQRKDGTTFPVMVELTVMYSSEAHPVTRIGCVLDLTEEYRIREERRIIEEQLRHSQKMEAIGQLAGGVAHDFNNMLQVIMGYATFLGTELDNPVWKSYLQEILNTTTRAAELTQGLLAYSRKQVLMIVHVDLNRVVESVESFLRRIIGEEIHFTVSYSSAPVYAMADKNQLQQVLINLASNARDAMPRGGDLTIRILVENRDEQQAAQSGQGMPGEYAVIEVADTGAGISSKVMERMYEPFFSTKGLGKGTGLGLSMVQGIMGQHNGFVTCCSREGEGTMFRLSIPRTEAPQEPYRSEVIPSLALFGEGEILIAEDDPEVCNVIANILQVGGYRVHSSANGEEALACFREHSDTIDLVLLDVVMPLMNGKQALDAMRIIRPDIKACFISGYAYEVLQQKMDFGNDCILISKPISPSSLLACVKMALEG